MLMPADCLDDLAALELDDESTRLFLRENAKRVFSLTED
jgi:predicted TIM-barrel fold metal-dependent hydrolase